MEEDPATQGQEKIIAAREPEDILYGMISENVPWQTKLEEVSTSGNGKKVLKKLPKEVSEPEISKIGRCF